MDKVFVTPPMRVTKLPFDDAGFEDPGVMLGEPAAWFGYKPVKQLVPAALLVQVEYSNCHTFDLGF